jgi:predicted dehydrogenase
MISRHRQQPLRAIVCGYGLMGMHTARQLMALDWIRIVAVVDPSRRRRNAAAIDLADIAPMLFESLPQALDATEAQVVFINSPAEYHEVQIRQSLNADCNVVCAKPFTLRLRQARELVDLARSRRRKIAIGQQMRFNRHYRILRQLLTVLPLGRVESVFFLNSKPRPEPANILHNPHPALYEMSCHHFDTLLSLFPKHRPESVFASEFNPSWSRYKGPSMVHAVITLQRNLHVLYHAGFSAQAECYEIRLEGTQGVLRTRGQHMSGSSFTYEFTERNGSFQMLDTDSIESDGGSPWDHFHAGLRQYLLNGKEPPFSGRRNLVVMNLIDAAIRSSTSGKTILIN